MRLKPKSKCVDVVLMWVWSAFNAAIKASSNCARAVIRRCISARRRNYVMFGSAGPHGHYKPYSKRRPGNVLINPGICMVAVCIHTPPSCRPLTHGMPHAQSCHRAVSHNERRHLQHSHFSKTKYTATMKLKLKQMDRNSLSSQSHSRHGRPQTPLTIKTTWPQ